MILSSISKGALRGCKNTIHGYSNAQTKVRQATSNDPRPSPGKLLNEIAQLSYTEDGFMEIIEILDKRLNDKGKYWRHVFKSLVLIDYLLYSGSDNAAIYFKNNIYIIKTLREFQYIDDDGKDEGANVRQKAKDITNLLQDEGRLRAQRKNRARMRDHMLGSTYDDEPEDVGPSQTGSRLAPTKSSMEAAGLRPAMEGIKRDAERRRASAEEDNGKAFKLSKEGETKRAKTVAGSNAASPSNAAHQQNSLNDLIDISIPQQPTFNQPMQLVQIQPQFTSVDPWLQQAQQDAMQAEYARQQMEWHAQAQLAQLQQAQQDEWRRQQQQLQAQQLIQQQPIPFQFTPFGSNNPFTTVSPPMSNPTLIAHHYTSSAHTVPASSPAPSLQDPSGFRGGSTSAPPTSQQRGPNRVNQQHAHLAGLFADRSDDGVDTFGNAGQMRYGGRLFV